MKEPLIGIEDVLNGKYRYVEGQPVRRSYVDTENIGIENMKYKVGDRVRIKSLDWYNENKDDCGIVLIENGEYFFSKSDTEWCSKIVTIKEVCLDEYYRVVEDFGKYRWTDGMIEGLAEEETKSDKVIEEAKTYWDSIKDAWICPDGYQFKDENGNVINATKIVLEKKKKEYPKTYEECAKVLLDRASVRNDFGYKGELLVALQKLLVCRDAYWKIAGEEMGLGKPWKPDWKNEEGWIHCITNDCGEICCTGFRGGNKILAFPTAEMRDAFKKNFDSDIEICKELL